MGAIRRWLAQPEGVLVVTASLCALIAMAVAVSLIANDLSDTRQRLEMRTAAAAHLVDEHARRVLDGAELLSRILASRSRRIGMENMSATAAERNTTLALAADSHWVANFYLVDATGAVMFDGRGYFPTGTSFREREWVSTLKGAQVARPHMTAAAFDEASRTIAFTVARPMIDERGGFGGSVAVLVNTEDFRTLLGQLDLGSTLKIGVQRADGGVLVQQPFSEDDTRESLTPEQVEQALIRGGVGILGEVGPLASTRVMAYRVLADRRLVAWASVESGDVMRGWQRRSAWVMAVTTVTILALGLLMVVLWRQLGREHRASMELASLNRDLKRSNDDLEQFAHIASHDLKEPLRNIASYVQLLQRRYQGRLDPDADAFIGYTVDGVRRMQAIISELLAYSRIGTGRLTLTPVQSGVLVSTALTHLKSIIAEAQAAVEVEGPLPVVEADAVQLGSLFQNLIGNALKYRRDDVRPEVLVACRDDGDEWTFSVRDNGIGIDAQYHRQIFDLFKRLHPRERYPGTGIGLAICQRVVERHGGRIWVESQVGRGSTFLFSLPKRPRSA